MFLPTVLLSLLALPSWAAGPGDAPGSGPVGIHSEPVPNPSLPSKRRFAPHSAVEAQSTIGKPKSTIVKLIKMAMVGPIPPIGFHSTIPVAGPGPPPPQSTAMGGNLSGTVGNANLGMPLSISNTAYTLNRIAIQNAINAACGTTYSVRLPGGNYGIDNSTEIVDSCLGSNDVVSLHGEGAGSTVLYPQSAGNLLHVKPPSGQVNAGHASIGGFRVYATGNFATGAGLLLDHAQQVNLDDLDIEGMFYDLQLLDTVGTNGTRIALGGLNSSPGASLAVFQRATNLSTDVNNSEDIFSAIDWRAGTAGGYTHSVLMQDCDGCWFGPGHIGFSSGAMFLVTPQRNASGAGTIADAIDGLHYPAIDFDTSTGGPGLDFEPLAGFGGTIPGIFVMGGSCNGAVGSDCYKFNDPAVQSVQLTGISPAGNQGNGVGIYAGALFSLTGGTYSSNNIANNGSCHVTIGGTATHVVVSGIATALGTAASIPASICEAGSADYIAIGTNAYSSSGTDQIDVVSTSTGQHNAVPASGSTTDSVQFAWPLWNYQSNEWFLSNSWGTRLFGFGGPNNFSSGAVFPETFSAGSPIVQLIASTVGAIVQIGANNSVTSSGPPSYTPVGSTYAILTSDTGKCFNNTGAGGTITYTLPPPTAGQSLQYCFTVTAAQTLQVDAASGTTIQVGSSVSSSGGHVSAATIGDNLWIYSINGTQWFATQVVGTWSAS